MNIKNLKILVAGLRTIPESSFDMALFKTPPELINSECGTAACCVGHAPSFKGLEVISSEIKYDGVIEYLEYSERVFGLSPDSHEWQWCFGGGWDEIDNTLSGAIKRINYFIENGTPDEFDGADLFQNEDAYLVETYQGEEYA